MVFKKHVSLSFFPIKRMTQWLRFYSSDNISATRQEQADRGDHGETRGMAEQERGTPVLHDPQNYSREAEARRRSGQNVRGARSHIATEINGLH